MRRWNATSSANAPSTVWLPRQLRAAPAGDHERAEAKQSLIRQLSRLRGGARDLQLGETVALDRFAQLGGLDLSARAWRSMADPNPRIGVGVPVVLAENRADMAE